MAKSSQPNVSAIARAIAQAPDADEILTAAAPAPAKLTPAIAEELNAGDLGNIHADEDANDALLRALGELGDEAAQARVIVSRQSSDPRVKNSYVCEWYACDFSIAQLAAGFGGGNYVYKVIAPGGQFLTRGKLSIEEPKNPAAVRGISGPREDAAPDTAAAITKAILEAIKPLIERPQKSTVDLLNELKMMREVFAPAGGVVAEPKTLVQSLREAAELQTVLRGLAGPGGESGGGDSAFTPVILKLLDQFGPLFTEKLKAAPPVADAPQLAPPAVDAAPDAAAGTPPAPVLTEGGDMSLAFRRALADLAAQARAGKDANLYANIVYDRITDQSVIVDLCTRADWWEYLCNLNNDIRPYAAWFTALHAELAALAAADGLIPAPVPLPPAA